jgi:hypothetical protein
VVCTKADSGCVEPSGISEFVSAQRAMADGSGQACGALRTSVPTEPEMARYTATFGWSLYACTSRLLEC